MIVRRVPAPAVFLSEAGAMLLEDEARHNLMLGIAGTLRDHPQVYREYRLWIVEDSGAIAAAALQTPPFNLVLARPAHESALAALGDALASDGIVLPGVTGARPEADLFASLWRARSQARPELRMTQRIYRLTKLRPLRGVDGAARAATADDRELLVSWIRAFAQEALATTGSPAGRAEDIVDARLRKGTGGFVLWEDGEPVSLAGWGGRTPNGARIGPVYTPPELRGRGYGRAVTAAVSAGLLDTGLRFCFLYTDVANPTSNRIYMDIGYEPVCDSADYAFARTGRDARPA